MSAFELSAEDREALGRTLGFALDQYDEREGWPDSKVHAAVEAITQAAINAALNDAADAIDQQRYRRESDWAIGMDERAIYIDAAAIVRARTH